ncbi:hypothetical protein MLD38_016667 [Melastoma candidum]|uniref:Uncharacterized protein n=1 Tax=Melastoma candidum TaxID=119954 RepID=A0ACB9QR96_9MYRT|nr:hypothetical protein MLD38_016667 [Melastoma candidum]
MQSVLSRKAAVSVSGCCGNEGLMMGLRRWVHYVAAQPAPLYGVIAPPVDSPAFILPEFSYAPDKDAGYGLPGFGSGGSMEVMAVPKKKVSPHKRGIRNGPKALKPQPIIIRCKSCGRVKLQHFYCCSGDRGNNNERNQ